MQLALTGERAVFSELAAALAQAETTQTHQLSGHTSLHPDVLTANVLTVLSEIGTHTHTHRGTHLSMSS